MEQPTEIRISDLRSEIDSLDREIQEKVARRAILAREAILVAGYDHGYTNKTFAMYRRELGHEGSNLALVLQRMSTPEVSESDHAE